MASNAFYSSSRSEFMSTEMSLAQSKFSWVPRMRSKYTKEAREARHRFLKNIDNMRQMLSVLDMKGHAAMLYPIEWTVDKNVLNGNGDVFYNTNTKPLSAASPSSSAMLMMGEGLLWIEDNVREDETFTYNHRLYGGRLIGDVFEPPTEAFLSMMKIDPDTFNNRMKIDALRERISSKVFVSAGTPYCMGRLIAHFPKKETSKEKEGSGRRPISRAEAVRAFERSGLVLQESFRRLTFDPDEFGTYEKIFLNKTSSNGLPVMGNLQPDGTNEYTDAVHLTLTLAKELRKNLLDAYARDPVQGVWNYVREQETLFPEFWCFLGKCKEDYYSDEKMMNEGLRFYNCVPRHISMNIQIASQVLEKQSKKVGDQQVRFEVDESKEDSHSEYPVGYRSAYGISLHHGGGERLTLAEERLMEENGESFVHVGDDTKIHIRDPTYAIHSGALDCTSFDLTQHSDITLEIDVRFREELMKIDPVAGLLWFALIRQRIVLVTGTLAYVWTHAAPSGFNLIGKRNDVIQDVSCERTVISFRNHPLYKEKAVEVEMLYRNYEGATKWPTPCLRHVFAGAVKATERSMGLKIRLEQYSCVSPLVKYTAEGSLVSVARTTIKDCLKVQPFLFIGAWLYIEEENTSDEMELLNAKTKVCCDIPRTMAQLPFPGRWQKAGDFNVTEPMRMASIALNFGLFPRKYRGAQRAMVNYAISEIELAIEKFGPDAMNDKAIYATGLTETGVNARGSLGALLRLLKMDPAYIWMYSLEDLETKSVDMPEIDWLSPSHIELSPVLEYNHSVLQLERTKNSLLRSLKDVKMGARTEERLGELAYRFNANARPYVNGGVTPRAPDARNLGRLPPRTARSRAYYQMARTIQAEHEEEKKKAPKETKTRTKARKEFQAKEDVYGSYEGTIEKYTKSHQKRGSKPRK